MARRPRPERRPPALVLRLLLPRRLRRRCRHRVRLGRPALFRQPPRLPRPGRRDRRAGAGADLAGGQWLAVRPHRPAAARPHPPRPHRAARDRGPAWHRGPGLERVDPSPGALGGPRRRHGHAAVRRGAPAGPTTRRAAGAEAAACPLAHGQCAAARAAAAAPRRPGLLGQRPLWLGRARLCRRAPPVARPDAAGAAADGLPRPAPVAPRRAAQRALAALGEARARRPRRHPPGPAGQGRAHRPVPLRPCDEPPGARPAGLGSAHGAERRTRPRRVRAQRSGRLFGVRRGLHGGRVGSGPAQPLSNCWQLTSAGANRATSASSSWRALSLLSPP
mmetsp:Transcript_6203/g.25065  ORF Transcript_6203/g.25065 Transcript_6203/m.25065 type:complete len:334 (+) Transcript_6203:703-1704(+)